MKKEFLPVFFALYMVSPLTMANDNKPVLELNATQMDGVTAGSTATAGATTSGLLAASTTQTTSYEFKSSEGLGASGAAASAVALGDTPSTQTNVTTGGPSSNTFQTSFDSQGSPLSFGFSGAVSFP